MTAQDQQSRAELLPCPFCGSPNVTLEHIQSSAYEAFCEFCGASGPCDSEQWRAAKGWNARALPARGVDPMLDTPAGMEPALCQYRMRPTWRDLGEGWTEWKDCAPEAAADYERTPVLNDWKNEVRRLYTAAQVQAMGRVPPDWQAVPVEPSGDMLVAIMSAGEVDVLRETPEKHQVLLIDRAGIPDRYAAMLAAAPRPPAAQEVPSGVLDAIRAAGMQLLKGVGGFRLEKAATASASSPTSAAQERWLCLLCKSGTPGKHGLMDDKKTPCPNAGLKAFPRPPAAPATTEPQAPTTGAGSVTAGASPAYRLLQRDIDTIQADDEFLRDDAVTWQADPQGIFVGMTYMSNVLRPARRAIEPAP